MSETLLAAVLDGGIQNPYFFNGRVLTATDLRDTQRADVERARRLGQALGEGVAHGLFVTPDGQGLRVSGGLAINRRGDALLLPADQRVPLLSAPPSSAGDDSPFSPCKPNDPTSNVPAGFYLLAVTGATGLSGSAETSSLNGTGIRCASQYEVEGVQFKLCALSASDFAPAVPATSYRSQLAHACFGTAELLATAAAPFDASPRYGLVDALRVAGRLDECDVPLAVLHWNNNAVTFADVWAVRRPVAGVAALERWPVPANPGPTEESWSQHAGVRRRAEGRALFLQFQEQIEGLRTGPAFATLVAAEHFPYLPPAGYLPVDSTTGEGKAWLRTFLGLAAAPSTLATLDPAFLRDQIERSFAVDAIPVGDQKPVDVDLFTVTGAGNPQFVVFLRREQVVFVPEPAEPEEPEQPAEEQPPPAPADAHLLVAVVGFDGKVLQADQVASVTAVAADGTVYAGRLDRRSIGASPFERRLARELLEIQRVRAAAPKIELEERAGIMEIGRRFGAESRPAEAARAIEIQGRARDSISLGLDYASLFEGDAPARYRIGPIPPGRYTVGMLPAKQLVAGAKDFIVLGNSVDVTLAAGETETVVLEPRLVRWPGHTWYEIDPREKWPLPEGPIIDKLYLDPRWKTVRGPEPPRPVEIRDWRVDAPQDVREQVEVLLAREFAADPTLVVTNPQVYIRPDYTPDQIYDTPYAYVGTADGSMFPLVLVPGDHALRGDVPATRAGLRDLDSVTYNAQLRGTGLENLDALTGAWTGLLTETLGLGQRGTTSLVRDIRGVADRLQGSFETYPGVSAEASQALIAAGIADDIALANATPDAVLAVLRDAGVDAGYTEGFVQRLVDRARSIVSPQAWSLDGLALNPAERGTLLEAGVESRGGLLQHAADAVRRGQLLGRLGVDEAALNRLVDQTQVGMVAEQVRFTPDRGIARLEGITGTRARQLVEAGFATTTALANADRQVVAATLNISAVEAGTLVERAIATRTAVAVEMLPGLDAAQAQALRDRGFRSAGDLTRSDPAVIAGLLNDATLASRVLDTAAGLSRVLRRIG